MILQGANDHDFGFENFWRSLEAFCWGSGYTYEQYRAMHVMNRLEGIALDEQAYKEYCTLLNTFLRKHIDEAEQTQTGTETQGQEIKQEGSGQSGKDD